jgi:hypothetical protein
MAIDNRIGTKVIKNLRREDTPATRVDPYPYIGIVKNNLDPTRSGRLQIWIPDLGGDPDSESSWRTVGYASPFMGYTPQKTRESDRPSTANKFDQVPHTYGMWMVPPDIGVEVLVIFVAGDPNRGYWVACVNSNLSHHMLPGLAGSNSVELSDDSSLTEDQKKSSKYQRRIKNKGLLIPTTEFNEYDPTSQNKDFINNPKPVHAPQFNILKNQGLDRDNVRGSVSSSSQRETPSHVFGISTPGRPSNNPGSNDTARDPAYRSKVNAGISEEYYQVKSRKGGHTFVMDDGDVLGNDQLVRLRTANGHQIMMHDTAETLYISHANGNSWIELTKTGSVNVYGKNGIALRSEGPVNIHSDSNIIMNATNNITLRAGNKINMESVSNNIKANRLSIEAANKMEFKTGAFNVAAELNVSLGADQKIILKSGSGISQDSDPAAPVKGVDAIRLNRLFDTSLNSTVGGWANTPSATETAVTVLPSHEPYFRGAAVEQKDPKAAVRKMADTFTGTTDAIKNINPGLATPPSDTVLRAQPKARGPIGPLSEEEVRAYMAAIGQAESGGNYSEDRKQTSFIGKYQMGYMALIDTGHVKSSVKSNAQLNNPNSWTGKDGITSKSAFLTNTKAQDDAMFDMTEKNYKALISKGAITKDMTNAQIGGMMGAAHLLGAGGANTWRKTGQGQDANGTTGDKWYAVAQSGVAAAGKIPGLDAG